MKALYLLGGFIVFSLSAQAQVDLCQLAERPLPAGIQISPQTHRNYLQKLKAECQLQKQYMKLGGEMISNYGVPLENITEYKALRFVDRGFYESAKMSETPVQFIYQKRKADYGLPLQWRSTEIWDNWDIGISQMNALMARVRSGYQLKISDIQEFHRGMFSVSDEVGDFSHLPVPGSLKEPTPFDNYWFKIPTAEVSDTFQRIEIINSRYQRMGLLTSYEAKSPQKHLPLRMESNPQAGYVLYGGDTRANAANLQNLMVFLNTVLDQGLRGEHLVWKGELLTRVEAALLAQQFFVQLHPFREGNGRMSRVIQELPLILWGLPHMASGDLMDVDVLTPLEGYYSIAMAKTNQQFQKLSECLTVFDQLTRKLWGKRKPLLEQIVPYECRVLN